MREIILGGPGVVLTPALFWEAAYVAENENGEIRGPAWLLVPPELGDWERRWMVDTRGIEFRVGDCPIDEYGDTCCWFVPGGVPPYRARVGIACVAAFSRPTPVSTTSVATA